MSDLYDLPNYLFSITFYHRRNLRNKIIRSFISLWYAFWCIGYSACIIICIRTINNHWILFYVTNRNPQRENLFVAFQSFGISQKTLVRVFYDIIFWLINYRKNSLITYSLKRIIRLHGVKAIFHHELFFWCVLNYYIGMWKTSGGLHVALDYCSFCSRGLYFKFEIRIFRKPR